MQDYETKHRFASQLSRHDKQALVRSAARDGITATLRIPRNPAGLEAKSPRIPWDGNKRSGTLTGWKRSWRNKDAFYCGAVIAAEAASIYYRGRGVCFTVVLPSRACKNLI